MVVHQSVSVLYCVMVSAYLSGLIVGYELIKSSLISVSRGSFCQDLIPSYVHMLMVYGRQQKITSLFLNSASFV